MSTRKKMIGIGILLISLSIFIFLSLLFFSQAKDGNVSAETMEHRMGFAGGWVSKFLFEKTIGYASFIFPLLIFLWGFNFALPNRIVFLKKVTLFGLAYALLFSMGYALSSIISNSLKVQGLGFIPFNLMDARWGLIGGSLARVFFRIVGMVGSLVIFPAIVIITTVFAFEFKLDVIVGKLERWLKMGVAFVTRRYDRKMFKPKRPIPGWREIFQRKKGSNKRKDFPAIKIPSDEPREPAPQISDIEAKAPPREKLPEPPAASPREIGPIAKIAGPEALRGTPRKYTLPSPDLLDAPPENGEEVSWDDLMNSAKTLEERLADFGIQGKVVEINPGPVITRYEIEPAPGVKISRFTSLSDDLALVMRAKRIRVVAPIPGKAAIGIEIPNRKPSTVYLRSIIDSARFRSSESPLTLALGKTIAGDIYVDDLSTMPHLLIAGATGSGKSVCLNSIIASILYKATPDQVQLVMIDPKRLELSVYSALKYHHLAYRPDVGEEVVTNPSNAVPVLRSLELEMERRYELLAKAGVRHITDYNKWLHGAKFETESEKELFKPLKYLVLIVDELADLMLTAARDVEEPIARLTQMSRAVGIHLIVATQRPSVDVITGVIKANFPARIAFQVASKTDSRTILDMNGAEKLLGKGDMLFLPPASPEPVRVHAAFISHEEVKRIIKHIRTQPIQEPKFVLPAEDEVTASRSERFGRNDRDDLFNEALKLVVRHQQGSVSLLQRRLKVGYARAARIIDQMEDAGFVGPFDGSKAREVLVDEDYLIENGLM
ncbi:MAG: DNA translocase FtsK [Calditrichaeota bacterium]|nr:DNA translocase FtsK [Calditrichota bacterium]